MKITKRWLAVAGVGLIFSCGVPPCLAKTAGSAASPSAAQVAAVTPALSATANSPAVAQSPTAVRSATAIQSPAAAARLAPASASSGGANVGGMQTAALGVRARPQRDDTPPGRRLYEDGLDGARLDPFNWAVHILKSRHRVEIYYERQLFATYHAVFGRAGLSGGKEWAGDSRTPEGSYLIVSKHPSARFDWFLELNYPNGIDEERFEALRDSRQIPPSSHEGSKIGIHGTDSPLLNVQEVNWTLGCISVDNSAIDEMASLLPVGTLVVINP